MNPFEMLFPLRGKDGIYRWFLTRAVPVFDENGKKYQWVGTNTDVTEQVETREALAQSASRFRLLIEEAPVATSLFVGRELRVDVANDLMFDIWGKGSNVIGKTLTEILPELIAEGQPFLDILDEVYTTGVPFTGTGVPAILDKHGVRGTWYYDFTYKPLRNAAGEVYAILQMAMDVTERVLSRKKLEESESRLRTMIATAPAAICILMGEEMAVTMPNASFIEVVGKGPDITGKPLGVVLPELAGEGQPFLGILKDVYENGNIFKTDAALAKIMRAGVLTDNYFNITFSPLRDADGNIYGILDVSIDVTALVLAQKRLEEAQAGLSGAIEIANLGTFSVDVAAGTISVSQRTADWFGFDELTYPVSTYIGGVGESDRAYVNDSLSKALQPGSDGRYDVVHSIVNAKTGDQTVIHALSQVTFDSAGQPAYVNGIAQDITIYRNAQASLEKEVQQRTEELQAINEELEEANTRLTNSNEELAQYAYVASHDLQEPLRKIQVFSGLLERKQDLDPDTHNLVLKIGQSSNRMGLLIRDLLDFSRLLNSDTLFRPTDLSETVAAVVSDFELRGQEKGATFRIGALPTLQAVGLQMNQLFYNLVSNGLKFSKPDLAPIIEISAAPISSEVAGQYIQKPLPFAQYYRICVKDNGIGFDQQYAEQIFEVFKRLHGRDVYPGSGIGLALCRRIIANHHGAMYTEAAPDKGATFCIILPDKQDEHLSALPEGLKW